MVQLLWKTVWQFLVNLIIDLPYDAAVAPLDIYPTDEKCYVHTKACIQIFIADLYS